MAKVQLIPDSRGYLFAAIAGLLVQCWTVTALPSGGRLKRNAQIVTLDTPESVDSYRLLVFKIGESGRARKFERRIEITSTYLGGGLTQLHGIQDVVLGYEPQLGCFVGFDPRRLEHGGDTQNASAFIDGEALRLASADQILIIPRESELFGIEYHAIFKPQRLAEYLSNSIAIHAGAYGGGGKFSDRYAVECSGSPPTVTHTAAKGDAVVLVPPSAEPVPRSIHTKQLKALETGRSPSKKGGKISADDYQRLLRLMEQNGVLAEKLVLDYERRRLKAANRIDLAEKVTWTSRENVAAGYDISSFEVDGSPRYIEVKAVSTRRLRFIITKNEWSVAKDLGDSYWIYVVTEVRKSPKIHLFQDPTALEEAGTLSRRTNDWVVTLIHPPQKAAVVRKSGKAGM